MKPKIRTKQVTERIERITDAIEPIAFELFVPQIFFQS